MTTKRKAAAKRATNRSSGLDTAAASRRHLAELISDDAIVPSIRTRTILAKDGAIIREPTAQRASWRDPDDLSPNRRSAKTIDGYRAPDAIDTLVGRGCPITKLQQIGARRLRRDHDNSSGHRTDFGQTEYVDQSFAGSGTSAVERLDSIKAYREAKEAVPRSQWPVLDFIIIQDGSIRQYAIRTNMRKDTATGYLLAALDCLVDHYGLREQEAKRRAKQ